MPEQKTSREGRKPYKTDATDAEWELIGNLIPPAKPKRGCEPTDLREIFNTIRYQNHTGCQWDMLPHDLSARSTAFGYYTAWQENGVWELLLDTLRRKVRVATPRVKETADEPAAVQGEAPEAPAVEIKAEEPANEVKGEEAAKGEAKAEKSPPMEERREETPSFVIMDSQSVKTTEVVGEQRGYDGGKKVKGRKRHIAVDTLGLLTAVVVTAANISDGRGACQLLKQMTPEKFPRLKGACGDGRYNDKSFIASLEKRQLTLEVKSRPPCAKGFVLLKKRWIVERTFAWLGFNRRLSKDYERTVRSSETRVRIAAIGMMLKRLTKAA
jgi:putative transposase